MARGAWITAASVQADIQLLVQLTLPAGTVTFAVGELKVQATFRTSAG